MKMETDAPCNRKLGKKACADATPPFTTILACLHCSRKLVRVTASVELGLR